MTVAVGIFDLFTYTIPGALYLGLFSYLAFRLHWITPGAVTSLPTVLLIAILVLGSYLLGYMAYPVGALLNKVMPQRRDRRVVPEFLRRVPGAKDREFVRVDRALLLGAIQMQDKDLGAEVARLRAAGLMLRNSAPALILAGVTAIVETFAGPRPGMAAALAVGFAGGSVALLVHGRRFSLWAGLKTLELAFWLPDIDKRSRPH